MKNVKDMITNVCGLIIVLSGTVVSIEKAGIAVPVSISHAAVIAGVIAVALIGYYTGKPNTPAA